MKDDLSTRGRDRRRDLQNVRNKIGRTLDGIPTILARLVYVTSFRDDIEGYRRDLQLEGCDESDLEVLLTEIHEVIFAAWLNLSLSRQREDLQLYVASFKRSSASEVETWLALDPYLHLIPSRASSAERELYRMDLEVVLKLLKTEFRQG